MKKLFSLVLISMVTLGLFACQGGGDSEDVESHSIMIIVEGDTEESYDITFEAGEEATLLELIEQDIQVTYDETDYGPMITSIGSIEANDSHYIGFYVNGNFASEGVGTIDYQDGDVFTFTLEEIQYYIKIELESHGETTTDYVTINDHETLLDILEANFDIAYDATSYGAMLTKIGDIETSDGNYIAIKKNGEMALEGIETTNFEANDVFTFSLEWWDYVAHANDILSRFETHYTDAFLDADNYYILAAYNHLDIINAYAFETPTINTDPTASELVKYILASEALGIDVSSEVNELETKAHVNHLYSASLFSMALNSDSYNEIYLDAVASETLGTLDLDTLSMILMALNEMGNTSYDQEILDIFERDLYTSEFGDNSATFAHVIMALISSDINPQDPRFGQDEFTHLIATFLSYHAYDGSFYYQLEDENTDMMFSTPQAILALAMFVEYQEHTAPINPFQFE